MSAAESFGLEYYDQGRFAIEEDAARASLDMAVTRSEIADLLFSMDHALHCLFVSGEEPDWAHPSQRKAILDAREKMIPLLDRLGMPR